METWIDNYKETNWKVIINYFYDMLCELFKIYKEELIHKLLWKVNKNKLNSYIQTNAS